MDQRIDCERQAQPDRAAHHFLPALRRPETDGERTRDGGNASDNEDRDDVNSPECESRPHDNERKQQLDE